MRVVSIACLAALLFRGSRAADGSASNSRNKVQRQVEEGESNDNEAAANDDSAPHGTEEARDGGDEEVHEDKESVEKYHLWPLSEIKTKLDEWKEKYPKLAHITTSQEKFGLPRAGGPNDCPFEQGDGCPNYIMTIQDFVVHPEGSESSNRLPEVFWSGCLHGNERVGPTAVMEASALLLEAATCEAKPDMSIKSTLDVDAWKAEISQARACRRKLELKGIDNTHRKWLARLVATRRIVVVPASNTLGYFQDRREENGIDPNRDFPYDLTDPRKCMQTIAGRTLNEIYREHMFQLAFTFHGGMEVIGYEWGAPTWYEFSSPDDEAQHQIASAYSRYGGGFASSRPYNYGTMNDLVYYVRGGMEDWAYAASWDPERVVRCTPATFGGYPEEKTIYNNSTLRVFNMLVETSDDKTPRASTLGTSLDIMNPETSGNGHVSRNIRLSLLSADMVAPYLSIFQVNNLALSDDVVPLRKQGEYEAFMNNAVTVHNNAKSVNVSWTVGGAIEIDETDLWYARWSDVSGKKLDCSSHPSEIEGFKKGKALGPTKGNGVFSRAGSHPRPSDYADDDIAQPLGPVFQSAIDVSSGYKDMDKIIAMAVARVDKSWTKKPGNLKPNKPAQSHIVNVRNDPTWRHESGGKIIQGQAQWCSAPFTIVIGDYADSVGKQGHKSVSTIELHNRFGESTGAGKSGMRPKSADKDQMWFPVSFWTVVAAATLLCVCCGIVAAFGLGRSKYEGKTASGIYADDEFDEYESDFTKPYSDATDEKDVEFPTLS